MFLTVQPILESSCYLGSLCLLNQGPQWWLGVSGRDSGHAESELRKTILYESCQQVCWTFVPVRLLVSEMPWKKFCLPLHGKASSLPTRVISFTNTLKRQSSHDKAPWCLSIEIWDRIIPNTDLLLELGAVYPQLKWQILSLQCQSYHLHSCATVHTISFLLSPLLC